MSPARRTPDHVTRRAFLAGGALALSAASAARALADAAGPRIVALDWGLAAILAALGCPPVGIPSPA